MTDLIASPLPTVEEILSGESQGGVPRPSFLRTDEGDGSVQRVGSAPVLRAAPPAKPRATFWQKVVAFLRRNRSAYDE